jgi:hypothetical protein
LRYLRFPLSHGDPHRVMYDWRRSSTVSKMAVDRPFPKGTFKIELGPGQHEVSAIFKPTQSTIVFSRTRPGELASEYQVHHTRPGQFGRFDEAAVVGAARELALALVEKMGPR